MANENLLEFQRSTLREIINEDGLLILGRGLGLRRIVGTLLSMYMEPGSFVLLMNSTVEEDDTLQDEVRVQNSKAEGIRIINNETLTDQRIEIYRAGGILSVTSRILIVDILSKRIPTHLVQGIIVLNAHKISPTSTEAFILRVFRQENKEGFIKAFSDQPEQFVTGFAPLQRTLKLLYLRHVYLWPRFHVTIAENLDQQRSDVVELRQPLSDKMAAIQQAVIECMDSCLMELRRTNATIDIEDFTVENALFKSFDAVVRMQLDPIWHRVSAKTKQLVGDMKTLRRLLAYLGSYDCVTFNSLIETIIASNTPPANSINQLKFRQSPWLFMDAADIVVLEARNRVYEKTADPNEQDNPDIPPGIRPILEELPKWNVLTDVLEEIELEKRLNPPSEEHPSSNTVLIMTETERTAIQISDLLRTMDKPSQLIRKEQAQSSSGWLLQMNLFRRYLKWKGEIAQVRKNIFQNTDRPKENNPTGAGRGATRGRFQRGAAPPGKRRRVRGGTVSSVIGANASASTSTFDQEASEIAAFINSEATELNNVSSSTDFSFRSEAFDQSIFDHVFGPLPVQDEVVIRPYNGDSDDGLLEELNPRFIVMYDPDPGFVRRVEVYRALRPGVAVRIYFMIYDNSVEEQRYLSIIRKEKEAFEKLIREKSTMAIPINQDGRVAYDPEDIYFKTLNTRIAGGSRLTLSGPPKVVVDVREFRSSLPSILHAQGMIIEPCTLQIGDYILSPDICVERKSIADLIGSFQSGRLYTQCENMMAYYKTPILLIEFDQNKSFSLQAISDMKSEVDVFDLSSKIVLLSLHFPKLRIIWSSSAYATAEIFDDLKKKHAEPDMEKAIRIGLEDEADIDSIYNLTPQDMLRSLPGITSKNYRMVMNRVENLYELSEMRLGDIQAIIGEEAGKKLYNFFHRNNKGEKETSDVFR